MFTFITRFKVFHILLAVLATYIGFLNDIEEIFVKYLGYVTPTITFQVEPNGSVHVGQDVHIAYQAPDYGYLSLWNWNTRGEVKRLQATEALNANNNRDSLTMYADTPNGTEKIIALWTAQKSEHLTHDYYPTDAAFRSALTTLGSELKQVEVSIQVYP